MTSAQDEKAGTTPEQRMLRASAPPDFLESADEWRRLFSEAWGTFLLVVVAAGAGVVGALSGGTITLGMKAEGVCICRNRIASRAGPPLSRPKPGPTTIPLTGIKLCRSRYCHARAGKNGSKAARQGNRASNTWMTSMARSEPGG
jgi:hypothetical protein